MYNIKDIINRMKKVANIESNAALARELNVSYNTLNTWIKRNKFPQEILISFVKKYSTSLDYLIFGCNEQETNCLSKTNEFKENNEYIYYGEFEPLNINRASKLVLDSTLFHSGAFYLLLQKSVYYIAKVYFNPFESTATIKTPYFNTTIKQEEFLKYNLGLIKDIKNI